MQSPDVICLDFETMPIQQRPAYPPKPVGVALQWPRSEPVYLAFGHPTGNNCSLSHALTELDKVWASGLPILCHHAKFDLAVSYEALQLPRLAWDAVHDTMFLAYLCDPHSPDLGLKETAEDLLEWPPEERDVVVEWVMAHAESLPKLPNRKGKLCGPSRNKRTKDGVFAGAWIGYTPGNVTAPYACGDVARTVGIFQHLWPIVQRNGMGAAYNRERQLLPILMENEEIGMRVDLYGLERDIEGYSADLDAAELWLRRELRSPGLNFDADRDVGKVLLDRGIVPEENWQTTKSGQLSMSKENLLPEHFTDPRIASALGYRNRAKTCLEMFMKPWHEQGYQRRGYISTNWNQTRGEAGGTRTGRPSTSHPNFLNISKDFEGRDDGYKHPEFLEVSKLPLCRKYILPDDGEVFLHRDFDGQELRVFAHFEQGDLWEKYQDDPALDPHKFIGGELMRVAGREIERTKVKVLNFQSLYGGGIPALQRKLRCSVAEGKELKAFHNKALPGRVILNDEIKRIVSRGDPIVTWGGRLFYPEAPGPDGRSKIYKLINYEIQGSAADLTKQSLIDWHSAKGRTARFLVTVYDEINITAPPQCAERDMALLRDVMEEPRLTVPMRSSGKRGATWGDLVKCP